MTEKHKATQMADDTIAFMERQVARVAELEGKLEQYERAVAAAKASLQKLDVAGEDDAVCAAAFSEMAMSCVDEVRAVLDALEPSGVAQQHGWRPVEWDGPKPDLQRVLFVVRGAEPAYHFVALGHWDPEREMWIDEETDGQNDRIEYSPGEVTHWMPLPEFPVLGELP